MFDFEDDASRREKCYTSVTKLPASINLEEPPSKRVPFSAIEGHCFLHTVDRFLPLRKEALC